MTKIWMNCNQMHPGMDVVSKQSIGRSVGSFLAVVGVGEVGDGQEGGCVDGMNQKYIDSRSNENILR
jgi:hypothetical protein